MLEINRNLDLSSQQNKMAQDQADEKILAIQSDLADYINSEQQNERQLQIIKEN